MIKNFEEYINEDYFSKLANRKDNNVVRKENEITEDLVMSYIPKNAKHMVKKISFRKKEGMTVVDIDGTVNLIDDIEEIPFQFGEVTGDFSCTDCKKLKSLEGCPRKVYGNFVCMDCYRLTSLNGAPEIVGGFMSCLYCDNLKNLEGFPKSIGGFFECSHCSNLESLKGAENTLIFGGFTCNGCSKLCSLEFLPKELKYLSCKNCGKKFTIDYIKSLCNIDDKYITI